MIPAEDIRRIPNAPVPEEPTHERRRCRLDELIRQHHTDRTDDLDPDPPRLPELTEDGRGPRASLPEVEVVPLDEQIRRIPLDQRIDERLGGLPEQFRGGFESDHFISSELTEPA